MKIYTGRGDEGLTDLRDMSRVSKTSPRIEAYGTVDEVNSVVGMARPSGYDDVDEKLAAVQNHLHVVQAEFANPAIASESASESDVVDADGPDDTDDASDPDAPRVKAEYVDRLEDWMDDYDDELEPLQHFVLPGGSDVGAKLHHARSVCRRAERRAVALAADEDVNETAVAYLNRLSDALFVWARVVNAREDVPEEAPTY